MGEVTEILQISQTSKVLAIFFLLFFLYQSLMPASLYKRISSLVLIKGVCPVCPSKSYLDDEKPYVGKNNMNLID